MSPEHTIAVTSFLRVLFAPLILFAFFAPGCLIRYAVWRWMKPGRLRRLLIGRIDRGSRGKEWQPPSSESNALGDRPASASKRYLS